MGREGGGGGDEVTGRLIKERFRGRDGGRGRRREGGGCGGDARSHTCVVVVKETDDADDGPS